MSRKLFVDGFYTLDHGRGDTVKLVQESAEFVIVADQAGGESVKTRAVFEEEAMLENLWSSGRLAIGYRVTGGALCFYKCDDRSDTFDEDAVVIDLTQVPEEAWIQGYTS